MIYPEFIQEWENGREYITAMTSGSTGNPKMIRLGKEFVRQSALRTLDFFGLSEGSILYSCISPDFIGGKMMAVRAMVGGCNLEWETPSNKPFMNCQKNKKIDLAALVPSQMVHVVTHLERIPEIRIFLIGGSAIDKTLSEKINKAGLNAYESYGMTETASHIALRRVGEDWFEPLEGISVTVDKRGCLEIYLPKCDRIVTNDLAETDRNGKFRILGRIDDVIVTGGKKINPLEVERVLGEFCHIPFMVTGLPDEKWGRRLVMVVEGESRFSIEELKSKCSGELPAWQIPKEIIGVDKLPRTSSGKIIRKLD